MRKLLTGTSLGMLMIAGAVGAAYGADYTPVTDARLAEPGAAELADDAGQLPGLELQPARPDQHLKRQEPGPGVERFDRGHFGP